VAALVDDQICQVDEEHSAVGMQGITKESNIEDEPANQCRTGDWLPGLIKPYVETQFVENRLQRFDHTLAAILRMNHNP